MDSDLTLAQTNPIAFQLINNAVQKQKAVQAYLFSAPRYYPIELEPTYLIKRLLGKSEADSLANYADLIIIDGKSTGISKEEVINALLKLNQTALTTNGKKFLLIKSLENASIQSLNALLKFIEEPTPETFIVLTTNYLSQVLPTLKSRVQIINLRAMPKTQFVKALSQTSINTHQANVLSLITDSASQAITLNTNEAFWNDYKNLLTALETVQRSPVKTFSDLGPFIRKDQALNTIQLLTGFVNDVWKTAESLTPTLHEAKRILNHYVAINFNYSAALTALNEFAISLTNSANFDLAKNAFLISWERCYG